MAARDLPNSLDAEVQARLQRLELDFNDQGFDPFGASRASLATAMKFLGWLYYRYFRVECHGVEHIPARGRAMLVGNHSGGYAIDAGMVIAASFFELEPPRLAQSMADRFLGRLPFVSEWAGRTGQLTGLPQHARRLLNGERLLVVFPEGARGTAKLYWNRYTLERFGTGFVRLALASGTPIIPFAFLGGGEAVPTIANLQALGKLVGVPYLPITPYLLPLPLPARARIRFGAPLHLSGTGEEGSAAVELEVERVRAAIADLIEQGKPRRPEGAA